MNPFVVILIVLLILLCLLGGLGAINPLHCPGGTHKCCPDNNPNGLGCHCLPNNADCPPGQCEFGGEPSQ